MRAPEQFRELDSHQATDAHLTRMVSIAGTSAMLRWRTASSLTSTSTSGCKVCPAGRRSFSGTARLAKEKLAILGSGWGGYRVLQSIDKSRYDVTLISPVSRFSFTPLLAGAAVGSIEFRCAVEGVRRYAKQIRTYEAWADNIDFDKKEILCTASNKKPFGEENAELEKFHVKYDKLVISVGSYAQTFGIEGVKENAIFLRDVSDARKIRMTILSRFEEAASLKITDEQRQNLLHFAIVGGGPTGCEFAAELHDLVQSDIPRYYPGLEKFVSISLYEVSEKILAAFDDELQKYARTQFQREGITVKNQHHVVKVEPGKIIVKEEGEVPCGMCVWSTGLALNPLIEALDGVSKTNKALLTNGTLHVLDKEGVPMPDVWGIGDCAIVENGPQLPATAAAYVAKVLNQLAKGRKPADEDFKWKNQGSLAFIGSWKALYDRSTSGGSKTGGSAAFVLWRSAYFSLQLSWRNRIVLPFNWLITAIWGRDITRF